MVVCLSLFDDLRTFLLYNKSTKRTNWRTVGLTWAARMSGDITFLSVPLLKATAPKSWSSSISRSRILLFSASSLSVVVEVRLAALNGVVEGARDRASRITHSYIVTFSLEPESASRNSKTASFTFSAATASRAANATIRPSTAFAYATSPSSFVFSLRSLTVVKSWDGKTKKKFTKLKWVFLLTLKLPAFSFSRKPNRPRKIKIITKK